MASTEQVLSSLPANNTKTAELNNLPMSNVSTGESSGVAASAPAPRPSTLLNGNNGRPHHKNSLHRPMTEAVAIQKIVFATIKGDNGSRPSEESLPKLVKAWCDVEERRRILTNRPLPGVLKPENKPKARKVAFDPKPL